MTKSIFIQKTSSSRLSDVDFNTIKFGQICSDHLFSVDFEKGKWINPQILPYDDLKLSPATSALHYGQSIFEGMKAHRNKKDEAFIFRLKDHWKRFNRSAQRMLMPEISEQLFSEGMIQLLKLDKEWIPIKEGDSLYIRPFLFGTDEFIGARPSENYKFLIITSPANPYYLKPMHVKIETHYSRSTHGGTGFAKCAGNYGGAFYPTSLAIQEGYNQVIWTDSVEHKYIEESGTMNIIFMINNTLVTPALSDTILQGITRDSILTLAQKWKIPIEERKITIDELIEAIEEKKLQEAFGVGTAATIAPIGLIGYKEKKYTLPLPDQNCFSQKALKELETIKKGEKEDLFNWLTQV